MLVVASMTQLINKFWQICVSTNQHHIYQIMWVIIWKMQVLTPHLELTKWPTYSFNRNLYKNAQTRTLSVPTKLLPCTAFPLRNCRYTCRRDMGTPWDHEDRHYREAQWSNSQDVPKCIPIMVLYHWGYNVPVADVLSIY